MAYLDNVLQEFRAAMDPTGNGYGRNNLRNPIYGAFRAHLDNTSLLVPGLNILADKKTTGQAVKIPVWKKGADGTGTVRKCGGGGTGNTTLKTVPFIGIEEEFKISRQELYISGMSEQDTINKLLYQRFQSAYKRLEVLSVAHMETIKATINNGSIYGATTAGAKTVPYEQRKELFGGLQADMMSNDFMGDMNFVASPNLMQPWNYVENQGAQNGENLAYQQQGYNDYWSRFVTPGAGNFAAAYVFSPGTIGVLPWINQLSRDGEDFGTDVWSTVVDPIFGLTWEVKLKQYCADNSATLGVGAENDAVKEFSIFSEFGFTEQYAEDGDSGVYKYTVKNAA
jgi:hypothetical protein